VRRCALSGGANHWHDLKLMADPQLSPEAVDELLEAHEFDAAREALQAVAVNDESYSVARIKLALCDGSMPTGAAMQALIQLMRRNPDWPGAKALYQQASVNAFESHVSSHSHSHPPPPVERK
jgi:DNA-binding NarL/FixJ family response regulator